MYQTIAFWEMARWDANGPASGTHAAPHGQILRQKSDDTYPTVASTTQTDNRQTDTSKSGDASEKDGVVKNSGQTQAEATLRERDSTWSSVKGTLTGYTDSVSSSYRSFFGREDASVRNSNGLDGTRSGQSSGQTAAEDMNMYVGYRSGVTYYVKDGKVVGVVLLNSES
jgi:hypothetical protein